jgi:arylsulfatase
LFDAVADPSECHDLADRHPEKVQELIGLWWAEAGRYNALPLEHRTAIEILGTERPQIAKPRSRYIYYPGGAEIPESVAPNIRNRSYTIAVEVQIDSPDAEGVLFSHGARFGGHALYLKGGKLKYVYNFVGINEQIVESSVSITAGPAYLSATFAREGDAMPSAGTLTLHIGTDEVGAGHIVTQPGKFSIAGEGPQRRQGRRGAGHRRLPGFGPVGVHRRHDQAGGHRRQRGTVRRPGPRSGGRLRPGLTD